MLEPTGQGGAADRGDGIASGPRDLSLGHWAVLAAFAIPVLFFNLGGARLLTYHESLQAGAAKVMAGTGEWLIPRLGGEPWLEKPPLPHWLTILSARLAGGFGEAAARAPSALSGLILAFFLAAQTARWFGATAGLLAGFVQASAVYVQNHGRLAEADMLLSVLVATALLAFSRANDPPGAGVRTARPWMVSFWILIGLTHLVKGLFFGAAIALSICLAWVAWRRDGAGLRRLLSPAGILCAAAIGSIWPLLVLPREPAALDLWTHHLLGRATGDDSSYAKPFWYYLSSWPWQMLPWTPFLVLGAPASLRRAWREPQSPDRFLWCWAMVPFLLLSLSVGKHHHFLIHALPALSPIAALGLLRAGAWIRASGLVTLAALVLVGSLAVHLWVMPRRDPYRPEREFLREVESMVPLSERLLITGGQEIARPLFYLTRPVEGVFRPNDLPAHIGGRQAVYVLARVSFGPDLARFGAVREIHRSLPSPKQREAENPLVLWRLETSTPGR